MKRPVNRISAALFLSGLFATTILAQTSAQEVAANLRVQLTEVQVRIAELQDRDEQLEENLKPENIERSLAGTGSTHPERLREYRQRQLEIARTAVRVQLDELDRNRTRLEAAVAEADAAAYWESACICIGTTQKTKNVP